MRRFSCSRSERIVGHSSVDELRVIRRSLVRPQERVKRCDGAHPPQHPRSRNEWIMTLLGGAIAVGCAIPLAQGVLSFLWPKVDGVITHSRDLPGYRNIGVDIGYSYATGGETYNGNRFRFSLSSAPAGWKAARCSPSSDDTALASL